MARLFSFLTAFAARLVDREAKSASKFVWESARAATYAPFVVSTLLMVTHHLDAEHWTWVTVATITADGAKSTAESFFEGLRGVVGKVTAIWGGNDEEED